MPYTTIRDRMDRTDLRFQAEARQRAAQFDAKPMTHEERQKLIRTPITFQYFGGKASGGTKLLSENFHRSIGGGFDGGSKDWELD